ncbi:hypothetical protein VNO77_26822 [Canavalia gladiata]|uniref:Uncharacterized protein n=1 Tax=Canavalia gladiata TaxID=3824 RepID=A0AAN9KUQ7_CANGL
MCDQAFHETGHRTIMLPGSRIPERFDHYSNERSITFWGRRNFPRICVCVAFGMLESPPHDFQVSFCIVINGHKRILSKHCYKWTIMTDHVWIFDLSDLIYNDKLKGVFMGQNWNHVEASCEDCEGEHLMPQAVHGSTKMAIVKWYGIHIYRQESKMEDISFTNAKIIRKRSTSFSFGSCCHTENDDDLEICHAMCKRQCR